MAAQATPGGGWLLRARGRTFTRHDLSTRNPSSTPSAALWPAEDRAEYAGAFGYYAARGARGLAWLLVFLPIVLHF